MKVFISWSGDRSHALAKALSEWIPLVLYFVKPWYSQSDIAAGQRWGDLIGKNLEDTNLGILCVTQENADAPWLLFEAGALSKSTQVSRIIPLLLDMEAKDILYPLAQFQCSKVGRAGLLEVVHSLNQAAPNSVPSEQVKQLFDALWPQFEKQVASIPKASVPAKHARPQHEVLEELVTSVRSLARQKTEQNGTNGKSVHDEFIEFMNHDQAFINVTKLIMDHIEENRPDHIEINLIAVSMRFSLPWFDTVFTKIAENNPNVKFLCKVAFINDKHLSRLNLDIKDCDWAAQSQSLLENINKMQSDYCQRSNQKARKCNVRFEITKYDEIPQRHGIMLKLKEEHIFLGVTDWDMNTESGYPRLTAGSNYYRHYDSTGDTGRYWINLFNNCFSFYNKYQKLLVSPPFDPQREEYDR